MRKINKQAIISLLTAILMLFGVHLPARPVLDFQVEWGYSQGIYQYHQYNILTSEGSRLYSREKGFLFQPSGDILVGVMFKPSGKSGISLMTGYAGIGNKSTAIPLMLRYSYFYKSMSSDGFFNFAESGMGFKIATEIEKVPAIMAGIGAGYRLKLTPEINMDILLSVRGIFDKPQIPDPEGQGFVDKSRILSNTASFYSVNASIALSF